MAVATAIILAAGRGARMWPFAVVRNKCAMPVGGVPNVRLQAEALAQLGVRRAVVVVGEHAGSVRAALLGAPLEIAYAEQSRPSGTADAALAGLRLVDDEVSQRSHRHAGHRTGSAPSSRAINCARSRAMAAMPVTGWGARSCATGGWCRIWKPTPAS
jgi:hypothetical protein